jgi:hypothetical protein
MIMDGLSGVLASTASDLSSSKSASSVQVKVLKEAMNQASSEILPMVEDIGQKLDVTA